mgnify:CR=1 FL=1
MAFKGEQWRLWYFTKIKYKGTDKYSEAYKVLKIVNKERKSKGLSELKMDKDLLDAAMQRAAEVALYFSHTRPDGSSCFSATDKMKRKYCRWSAKCSCSNDIMDEQCRS